MRMVLVAVALLGAPIATAAAQGGGMMGRIAAMDINHDGSITKAEARSAREAEFRAADTDNDGFLSPAERTAMRAQYAGQHAGGRPKGGQTVAADGKISRDDFMNAPYRLFDRFDSNHNDVLEPSELAAARTMALQRKQGTP